MLIDKGVNINAKDKGGKTPLHVAAEWGHFQIIQLLIEKGANPTDETNEGLTALGVLRKNLKSIVKEKRKKSEEILISTGLKE